MIIQVRTINTYFSDGSREMMVKLVYGPAEGGKIWQPIWRWWWRE